MRSLLLLVIPATLAAQALQISPSTAAPGATGTFLIRLDTPGGREPASLQWDMTIPKQILVDVRDIVPGSSAESAGKSLACVRTALEHEAPSCRCVLAGGVQ